MSDESSDIPEEYRMSEGERPERIRRRNLITGLVLLVFITAIVAVTIYTRSTSENASYGNDNPVSPPPTQKQKPRPDRR